MNASISYLPLRQAVASIKSGGVAIFKTETVYGLGAAANNPDAIRKIFHHKKRPLTNPLIVHVASLSQAEGLAHFNPLARVLATTFWPGALTLVLPRKAGMIDDLCCAYQSTVALRMPSYPLALRFIKACGLPIAAPSANISGSLSPTDHRHLPFVNTPVVNIPVVGKGLCPLGLESTICMPQEHSVIILREGMVSQEAIQTLCKVETNAQNALPHKALSPGMLLRHYATKTPLRINAISVQKGEGLVLFGKTPPPVGWEDCHHKNLSPSGSLQEACRNLFRVLHTLDKMRLSSIAVVPLPSKAEGRALNDRLTKAAHASSITASSITGQRHS